MYVIQYKRTKMICLALLEIISVQYFLILISGERVIRDVQVNRETQEETRNTILKENARRERNVNKKIKKIKI